MRQEEREKLEAERPSERRGITYEPPAVIWEESLDVRPHLALACGKITGPCVPQGGIQS